MVGSRVTAGAWVMHRANMRMVQKSRFTAIFLSLIDLILVWSACEGNRKITVEKIFDNKKGCCRVHLQQPFPCGKSRYGKKKGE